MSLPEVRFPSARWLAACWVTRLAYVPRSSSPRSASLSAHCGLVQGTAMPEMTVENDDRPRGCQQGYLVRMWRGRVRHLVLRQRAAQVRARHHTRRSVLRSEVVQQPDRVTYPKQASGHRL